MLFNVALQFHHWRVEQLTGCISFLSLAPSMIVVEHCPFASLSFCSDCKHLLLCFHIPDAYPYLSTSSTGDGLTSKSLTLRLNHTIYKTYYILLLSTPSFTVFLPGNPPLHRLDQQVPLPPFHSPTSTPLKSDL